MSDLIGYPVNDSISLEISGNMPLENDSNSVNSFGNSESPFMKWVSLHIDDYPNFEDGFKNGKDAAKEEFSPFLKTTQSLIEELSEFRKEIFLC